MQIKKVFWIFVSVLVISTLLCPVALAQNESELSSDEINAKLKQAKIQQALKLLLTKIHTLQMKDPPDYEGMATLYLDIFSLDTFSEQGKSAVWEAFELYRKLNNFTKANATLVRIMREYGFNDTMENPLDPTKPVNLRAAARFEQSRLYAQKKDFLTAFQISRSVPNQFPGAVVGRFSGEETYYGRVEVLCGLDAANYMVKTNNQHQALFILSDVIREYSNETIGDIFIHQKSTEVEVVRTLRSVVESMNATEDKKLSIYSDYYERIGSKLGKALLLLYQGEIYTQKYGRVKERMILENAWLKYKKILEEYPLAEDVTKTGRMPMSLEALRRSKSLFVKYMKDPRRAINEFSKIEKDKATIANQQFIAAYARYFNAAINLNSLRNPHAAIIDLEYLLREYPNTFEYPLPLKGYKPLLAKHAKKMLQNIREKNLGLPKG